jgi:hypothetical protein
VHNALLETMQGKAGDHWHFHVPARLPFFGAGYPKARERKAHTRCPGPGRPLCEGTTSIASETDGGGDAPHVIASWNVRPILTRMIFSAFVSKSTGADFRDAGECLIELSFSYPAARRLQPEFRPNYRAVWGQPAVLLCTMKPWPTSKTRDHVLPDIKEVAADVLNHRILLTYGAETGQRSYPGLKPSCAGAYQFSSLMK